MRHFNRISPGLAALGAAAIIGAPPDPASTSTAAPATPVLIADYAFKPAAITVVAGTTVAWTQKDDDPHTVTADDASFDSTGLGQGDVYRHTFTAPGRYPYHCSAHPFMKGVVIVTTGDTP